MKYTEPYTIPFFMATQKGTASLATLVNAMLMGSEHQLDAVDAGMDAVLARGIGWVITQYELDVKRMPKAEVPLILGTEATSYNKLMCYRDYWIDTTDGERLATMRGAWVMMDLTARKVVPVVKDLVEKVGAPYSTHVERFKRLTKLTRVDRQQAYPVRYFDIDANGHVNNVHYFEWMEDSLGADFLASHELASMKIKYAKELPVTAIPQAQVQIEGATTIHQVVTDGQINAEAEMTWRKR
ncbi:acyl-[acyl-carrier-protein] thioesterase [Lacticaseibacillus sp. N501-2]|uniref:acyl-[acyl-carrier-protein] thioesterase n=1 Tax=Lacticaseibacillus salsurae TaxID=3367729 RepID=UPI0038B271CD